jgi:hypothetical protein
MSRRATVLEESHEQRVQAAKVINTSLLVYVAWIMWYCPCRPEVFKCHLTQIYGALAIVVLVIVSFNGYRIRSYID